MLGSENPFPSVLMVEGDPEDLAEDAAAGQRRLAVGTDHLLYLVDDTGTKTAVGGSTTTVATDTIWNAAGDIVQGTGSDTAARLGIGTAGQVLTVNGGATAVAWATPSAGASALASASYIRTAGNYTTTSATFVDVDATNLALSITTGARRCMVGFTGTLAHSGTVNIFLDLLVDGTSVSGSTGVLLVKPPGTNDPASFTWLTTTLTAASHTFKLQWKTTSATATLYGTGGGGPAAQFWVAEMYL